ncbi:hypothetical protein NLM33_14080 [Bradyrhizobium sp. CCGUVB1N3]|uniref:hypothetical protein n=1 Tax=Bradyrhizobium sp. CCGUVB1N3 TaxID=2949629 RepID=UPI0020B31C83|nr:hypothetical protein [Bradyrhizobium sp. CCGUVB1N3]MCP3471459.1 hypothetical protein [Bradyrhizobium sp. CCGUVB1N3]
MSPIEAIASWLEAQGADLQIEIAGLATFFIFADNNVLTFGDSDVLTLGRPELLHSLQRWLNEPDLASCTAAERALTFRVSFEHFAESRFTDAGWKRTEELVRKTLEEAKRDQKFAAAHKAQNMLKSLSDRKKYWYEAGKSWKELAATYLTVDALAKWADSEAQGA